MKKSLLSIALILLLSSGCSSENDEFLTSVGKYSSKSFFTHGDLQDYTDYAKYVYTSANLEDNEYFEKISSDNKEILLAHIENFEEWLDVFKQAEPNSTLVQEYDFDTSLISEDDYLYIYDNPNYPELGCYNVYFFDSGTLTLYYFHNNI